MTGQRGDALVGGHLVDYLGQLRQEGGAAVWRGLATHARRTGRSRVAILTTDVLRRTLVDAGVRLAAAVNGPRLRRAQAFPSWVPPSTIRRYGLLDVRERSRPGFSSRTGAAGRRLHAIGNPMVANGAEATERLFSRFGLRYADPWSDWRLAELVMRIPPFHVTPAGEAKGLLREAMRGVMPEAARLAAAKRLPTAAYARGLLDRSSATVRSLIDDSRLARAGLVDASALRTAYARLQSNGITSVAEWRALWRFVDTEDWWRRFHDR
jgi:asparagine synthase (glutamine-hydrolysing)